MGELRLTFIGKKIDYLQKLQINKQTTIKYKIYTCNIYSLYKTIYTVCLRVIFKQQTLPIL